MATRRLHCFVAASAALMSYAQAAAAQLPPIAEASVQYIPASTVPNGGGVRAQVTSYDALLNVPVMLGRRTLLMPGLHYHADTVSYAHEPPGFTSLDTFHAAEIPILLVHGLSESWSLSARVWPGMASDFEHLDSGALRLSGLVMAAWSPGPRFVLGGGAMVSYGFGQLLPMPLVYVNWHPDTAFRVEANLPVFARLTLSLGDRVELGLQADVNGNEYSVREDAVRGAYPCRADVADDPATPEYESRADASRCVDHLAYSVVAAGGVARVRLVSSLWLSGFAGHTLYRRYEFENADGHDISGATGDIPNEIVFRVGLAFRLPEPGAHQRRRRE